MQKSEMNDQNMPPKRNFSIGMDVIHEVANI